MTGLEVRLEIEGKFVSLEKFSLTGELREFDLAAWQALATIAMGEIN